MTEGRDGFPEVVPLVGVEVAEGGALARWRMP